MIVLTDRKDLAAVKELIRKYTKDIWNVPNMLTIFRIVLIPVFVLLHHNGLQKAALAAFVIASLTDWLDGRIARKYNLVTDFGKLMDPLADKLMVCTALICQCIAGIFPWAASFIVMGKELLMVLGGTYMLKKGVVVYSIMVGKVAQVLFIAALILSFFHQEFAGLGFQLDIIMLWVSVGMTLAALAVYSRNCIRQLREKKPQKN